MNDRVLLGVRAFFVQPTIARALVLSAVVGLGWAVLAWRSPTLTYHFAPLVGAAIGPLSLRTQGKADFDTVRTTGVIVLAMMLGVALFLELAGRQEGPNFAHVGPAWPEVVLFAIIGVAVGTRTASRERPGLLGGIVDSST